MNYFALGNSNSVEALNHVDCTLLCYPFPQILGPIISAFRVNLSFGPRASKLLKTIKVITFEAWTSINVPSLINSL